jgi:hypothetical protein
VSEHEQNQADNPQPEENQPQAEQHPYEHKNPKTNQSETSNWSFGGWYEDEKKD